MHKSPNQLKRQQCIKLKIQCYKYTSVNENKMRKKNISENHVQISMVAYDGCLQKSRKAKDIVKDVPVVCSKAVFHFYFILLICL